ncbi:MAG: hypothetical protein PHW74_03675 [Desulfobacca sp.]|nr:hypothetical protein [Desulfobacca sp.]
MSVLNRHNFIRVYAAALIVFVGGLILWAFGYLDMVSIRLQLAAIGLWLFLVIGGAVYWFMSGGYPSNGSLDKSWSKEIEDENDQRYIKELLDGGPEWSKFP